MDFIAALQQQWLKGKYLCVGLDPDVEKIPVFLTSRFKSIEDTFFEFNKVIVDATREHAAAFKPNSAFYEAHGDAGWKALRKTIGYIKEGYPDIPVILDFKRGDIGNTNNGYVTSAFDDLYADAVTIQPYLGREAIQPFLDRTEKGIFVLVRTSNPGAGEFQDLTVDGKALYQIVAKHVVDEWNAHGNVGLVMGATSPDELFSVREELQDVPLLIPGVGAQGGDVESTVKAAKKNFLINSSRGILYASSGDDFAETARLEAEKLSVQIRSLIH